MFPNINLQLLTATNNLFSSSNINITQNQYHIAYLLYLVTALKKLKVNQKTDIYFCANFSSLKHEKLDLSCTNELIITTLCSTDELHFIANNSLGYDIICKASVLTFYSLKHYYGINNHILILPGTKLIVTNNTMKHGKRFIEFLEIGNTIVY
jgi:hypothetical protein